ncbi:hypothetical protein [Streptomyces sp. NPDC057428]|uniref:hypothetical protein n=1 Tax=Streptomyces sp. NPDC057428 TaxID=3346129 RepID=UPI0036D0A89F
MTIEVDDHRLVPPAPSGSSTPSGAHTPSGEPTVESTTAESAASGPGTSGPGTTTGPAVIRPATSGSASERERPRPPGRSAQPSPERRNSDAPPWVLARIRYAEESVAFDKRLGEYLAENEAVTAEFRKMASAAWAATRQRHPSALATFGDTSKFKAGVVGRSREALQRVVRSGNLRELVAFLYEGISSDLVPEMLGGAEEQHPEIAAERPSRRQREAYADFMRRAMEIQASDDLTTAEKEAAVEDLQASVVTRARPDAVRPPLSEAERRFAVNDAGLTWMPATSVYDIPMSAEFQGSSEDSGGLVATGTAGSTYRFMLHAARMREHWGLDLDLGLIRAGMMAISLTVGHHTVHEVMRGAQLALNDVPGHDPALDYTDNWDRYWDIYPLDEQELRENVARDGLFPDEHAQALLDELNPPDATRTGAREAGEDGSFVRPHRPGNVRPVAAGPDRPLPQMPTTPDIPATGPDTAAADLAVAWRAHARALTALGEAAAEAAASERNSGGGTPGAWAGTDEARRLLEDAEARLLTLGVALDEARGRATAATGRGDRPGADEAAPVVPRDAARRRWIAGQVTEADLPLTPPVPTAGETVGMAELDAAGVTPTHGQRTEMVLRGDGRLPSGALSPLDQVRVRMAGTGTWTDTLDMVAANTSRRLWSQAYAEFAGAAPEGADGTDLTRAWAAAVLLVLPAEPHAVLADSRYADDGFRRSVRQVAGHLLDAGTGNGPVPASAAELADTLRSGLGLRQRWSTSAPSTR